jgi:metal-dependent amidase/aminoacylase/carboxypeptidase family protein
MTETAARPYPTIDGAHSLPERLIALRRHLHAHPELSGEERETAAFVAARLRHLGLEVEEGIGGAGVVGLLRGDRPGPTVAYRADMDALPIQDTLGKPYAPLPLGIKHACGHDAHMTVALGLAEALSEARDRLHGQVVFVFQPAEESLDGAQAMLDDGLLQRYHPQAMLALHAFPLQVGSVGIAVGACLAGMEEFKVRFYTPAGDLEAVIGEAIAALEALSTATAPQDSGQFGALIRAMLAGDDQEEGGDLGRTVFLSGWPHAPGAVPPWHLLGLVSMADFALRPAVHHRISGTLERIAARHGAAYDLAYTFSNPPLTNHGGLVAEVLAIAGEVLEPESVLSFRAPYPFAHEDLARFAALVPTALIWLGTANAEAGIDSILHTPDYDIDEGALEVGVRVMRAVILGLGEAGPSAWSTGDP